MRATLNIFDHIRSNNPIKVLSFDSIKSARDAMHDLDCFTQPAEVQTDRFVCRNYPNLYAIQGYDNKKIVEDLYNARDHAWRQIAASVSCF